MLQYILLVARKIFTRPHYTLVEMTWEVLTPQDPTALNWNIKDLCLIWKFNPWPAGAYSTAYCHVERRLLKSGPTISCTTATTLHSTAHALLSTVTTTPARRRDNEMLIWLFGIAKQYFQHWKEICCINSWSWQASPSKWSNQDNTSSGQ